MSTTDRAHIVDPYALPPGTPVEVEHFGGCLDIGYIDTRGDLSFSIDPQGAFVPRNLGCWDPSDYRIVRVLGDVTPWPQVDPSEVRVGDLVEWRRGETVVRDRVTSISHFAVIESQSMVLWWPSLDDEEGCTLHRDPASVTPDPDAELIEAIKTELIDLRGDDDEVSARIVATVRAHDAKAGA